MSRDLLSSEQRFLILVACSCLALLARPAYAGGNLDLDDDASPKAQATSPAPSASSSSDDSADAAVKLPNFMGLSGMQDMVDARIPQGLTIRGGLRLEQSKENLNGPLMSFDQSKLALQAYAGVAAMELFEVGARLPFEFDHSGNSYKITGGSTAKNGDSFGDLDVGGKISIRLGAFSLAPYAIATLPSGDRRFNHAAGGHVGGAATVALLKSMIDLHANVDGAWLEGGEWAIDYRLGVSVVPLATKLLLIRPYVFLDGVQAIGNNPGSDMRVRAGVQGLLFDFVTVEAGGSYRFLSDATPHDLPSDTGTWSFEVAAGVAF